MRKPHASLLIFCISIWFMGLRAQQWNNTSQKTLSEKVDQYLTLAAKDYRFNGVALVAQKGNILLQKGYGWKNAKSKTLNDSSSIFQIGSLTKQFTATVILQLQEQGKLSVHDSLSKFFPGYPNGGRLTLHHLLTHTSGIYNYTTNLQPYQFLIKKTRSQKSIVNLFEDKPLLFEPGTQFSYTNSGYYLLGLIIEKVTGKPYEQVVRETLFTPLRMTHSGFDFRNLSSPSKTTGYSVFYKDRQTEAAVMDSTVSYAAGGIYSTAGDLYKWIKAVSQQQILSASSWKQALTPYKSNYAYGWVIDSLYGQSYITHGGQTSNFKSYIMYFPRDNMTLILLSNTSGDLWSMSIALAQLIFGQPYPWGNQPEVSIEEAVLNLYAGTYAFDDRSQFFINVEGSELLLSGAPATGVYKMPLVGLSETKFYGRKLDLEIEFVRDNDGQVRKLIAKREGMYLEGKKISSKK